MKKIAFLLLALPLVVAQPLFAQKKNKKDKKQTASATTPPPGVNINFLPLFGGYVQNDKLREEDQKFLTECDASFGSRPEASQFFESRAWEFLQEGRLDTAAYRFNLAWLLDQQNTNALWGLGIVSSRKGKTDEAIGLIEKGLVIKPTDGNLLVDLAALKINRYQDQKDKKDLKAAMETLEKAIQADSTNASALAKLSYGYFLQEDYDKAWEYLHKSRNLNMSALDFNYLTELLAKKEDPLGVFK